MKPYQNLSLEDMPGEVWKDIPGWEGRYQVSNIGRVKSLISGNRIRKQHKNPEGYMRITLVRGGLFPAFAVHRLVAITFIPNPECKPVIDHINGEREDNRVENLRWTTVLENANNPVTMKRRLGRSSPMKGRKGPECPLSKPIFSIDEEGRVETFWGVMDAKQRYNHDPGLIKKSLLNPLQKAYKKHWHYL